MLIDKLVDRQRWQYLASLLLAPVLVIGLATSVVAQRDANIAGKVVDTEGNPIANAVVTVHSPDRGSSRTLKTNAEGEYLGRGFRIDFYLVRVEAEGYATQQQEVKLNLGLNTVDATLARAVVEPDVDFDALNALYRVGFEAFQAQDWPVAESSMSELLGGIGDLTSEEASAMRTSAYEVLGRARQEQGNTEGAIAAYDSLLKIDPENLPAALGAAQAHQRNQDYDAALPYARMVVEIAPDAADMQAYAGAIMLQVNEVEEAVAALERAVAIQPEFAAAHKTLGEANLRTGEYAEAINNFKTYLEHAPDAADRADIEGMIEALEAQIQQ